tara:strand:- start:922 stop:1593 length:672 start_codon:yes stop_codon:yes gene_type:complete
MWEEDKEKIKHMSAMIDVAFRIDCKTLPYDHAYELSQAITKSMPWLLKDNLNGIHTLHGPESGNGWVRSEDEEIFLSKRTRLTLRVPRKDIEKTRKFESAKLNVLGNVIKIGKANIKSFLVVKDLICRFVLCNKDQSEEEFLVGVKDELMTHKIPIRKAICGKTKTITLNGETKFTRSLMIADLTKEHSIVLQDVGIGQGRIYGCGIFLPHKSIDAVSGFKEE